MNLLTHNLTSYPILALHLNGTSKKGSFLSHFAVKFSESHVWFLSIFKVLLFPCVSPDFSKKKDIPILNLVSLINVWYKKKNLLINKYCLTKNWNFFLLMNGLIQLPPNLAYGRHSMTVLSPPLLLNNILTCPCIYTFLSLLFHSTHIYWVFTLHLLVLLSRTWDREMNLSFYP